MAVKRNIFSVIIIMGLSAALVLTIAVFFVSLTKSFAGKAEINAKCETICDIAKKSKMPLTKESLIFLTDEYNRLQNVYSRFRFALESPLGEEVGDEELDPLQFKEKLIQTQKKLREDARIHRLRLPESLGFTEYETELTDPSEITGLLRKLKILEEIVYIMSQSGVDTLLSIEFPAGGKKDGPEKAEYADIPVRISVGCTGFKLINFLYKLRVSHFNFVVDDMDIVSQESNEGGPRTKRLEAALAIKTIILN